MRRRLTTLETADEDSPLGWWKAEDSRWSAYAQENVKEARALLHKERKHAEERLYRKGLGSIEKRRWKAYVVRLHEEQQRLRRLAQAHSREQGQLRQLTSWAASLIPHDTADGERWHALHRTYHEAREKEA